ncbi:hypothetical protein [Nocardia transvalensis]|nr:hypothetical protein [Nocardia transvalensis]
MNWLRGRGRWIAAGARILAAIGFCVAAVILGLGWAGSTFVSVGVAACAGLVGAMWKCPDAAVWTVVHRWIALGRMMFRRWRVPLTIVVIVVAFAAVLAWVLLIKHVRPETVPPWISATGSFATCIGVAVAVFTFRSQRRSQLEDQACQVRLLRTWFMPGPRHEGRLTWWMMVENRSDESVYDVHVMAVRAVVEDDGSPVWLRPIKFTPLGTQTLVTGDRPVAPQVKAGATEEFQWAMDADQTRHSNRSVVRYQMTVMDAKGRMWLVSDDYEPEKVKRPVRPPHRQLRT